MQAGALPASPGVEKAIAGKGRKSPWIAFFGIV